MAKVLSSDLASANSSLPEVLEELKSSSSNIANQIGSFISDSKNTLKGKGYDAVRDKLSVYQFALNTQKDLCSDLIDGIKAANDSMSSYMEGYAKLNDKEKEKVKASLDSCKANLDALYYMLYKGEDVSWSTIYAYQDDIAELKKLYEKLKGLQGADASAFGSISASNSSLNKFTSKVNGIIVSEVK